jgi:hypothetical protein
MQIYGYEPTREAAMAASAKTWRRGNSRHAIGEDPARSAGALGAGGNS